MSNKNKKVELNLEDFGKMVNKDKQEEQIIEVLKKKLEECEKANRFLNEQIKEYNKKFANRGE